MKYEEIKDLSVVELKKGRADLTNELFQAKMKNSIGQLANPLSIRMIRRSIAKVNTAIVKKVAR